MKPRKYKGKKPKMCSMCGKHFTWTRPFEVHIRQVGEKNCYKAKE